MMDIRGLAYVVAETTDVARWKNFAENVLGMMTAPTEDGGLLVRMDERQFRFAIQPGSRDAYVASGWEVLNQAAFEDALNTLRKHNVDFTLEDKAFCEKRNAQQVVSFKDPAGNRQEVIWGFKSDFTRFVSPVGVSRFVTEGIGMGHTVLPAPNFDVTERFYFDVMGFGLSDIMNFKPPGTEGVSIPIHFLHCNNGRHHSLALAGFPVESGCVHVMVEVEDMAEVGRAMDRMLANKATYSATLGQHTNDRMTSFYVRTPSNFDIEFGYGGLVLDWEEHIVHEFTHTSLWGHDFTVSNKQLLED